MVVVVVVVVAGVVVVVVVVVLVVVTLDYANGLPKGPELPRIFQDLLGRQSTSKSTVRQAFGL